MIGLMSEVEMRDELALLKARVDKMEAFLTKGNADWPMSPTTDQMHTSKTDDKAAVAKMIADA